MTEAEIQLLRDEVKYKISELRGALRLLAHNRKDSIAEYVRLANLNKRGEFEGVTFCVESLEAVAGWNYYEGHTTVQFPQSLLWSDAELDKIRAERDAVVKMQMDEKAEEIAERDRLLAKYPLEDDEK